MSEENGQLMQSIILKNEERSWDAPGDSRVEVLRFAALWFTRSTERQKHHRTRATVPHHCHIVARAVGKAI